MFFHNDMWNGRAKVHHIILYKNQQYDNANVPHWKVGNSWIFWSELSQFMSGMSRNVLQEIQNRVDKYELGKSHLFLPIYKLMCNILYYFPNNEHIISGTSLPWNGTWWPDKTIVISIMWNILTGDMVLNNLIFT